VFKTGIKDRFGDFYDATRVKKGVPGPTAY
jgi:hypothetical protein